MSIIASQLVGLVSISGAEAGIASLLRVGETSDLAKNKLALLGVGGALVAGAGLIALGVKSSDMAGAFDRSVTRLRTGGGDIQDSFNTLGNAIKKVAVDSGVTTTPLIAATYQIVSANQRGAQAYQTLAAAAQGAQIEQAKVVDVTKILTTLQTNWGLKTFTATQYMNGLVSAVSQGKISLEDLSTAMSPILPIAAQMGIHFQDVAAAMAVQTNAGLQARQAATGLQAVFVNLENPTAKASKAMKDMGVNSLAVANEMKKSLPGAIQILIDAALKFGPVGSVPFNRAMADMIGGGTRTAKTIDALTQHLGDWTAGVGKIGDAMKSSNKDVNGWALAQSGFNIQMDKAKASLEVLGITIGQALLPVLTKIVSAITPIIVAVTNWLVKNNLILPILGAMAAIIGGVLIASLISLVAASWPVIAVIAGIIAAVALVIFVIQHWGQIVTWLGDVWKTVSTTIGSWVSWLGSLVHTVFGAIGSFVGGVFSAIGTTIRDALTGIKNTVGGAFDWVGTKVRDTLTGVKNTAGNAFDAVGTHVHDALTGVKNAVGGAFDWLYNHNYYWKAIVDAWPQAIKNVQKDIEAAMNAIKNFIGGVFSAIGTFIHDRLVWIQNTVGAIFSAIGTFIHDRLVWIQNTVGAIFSAIGTFINDKLNWVKNTVGAIFDTIGTWMSSKATAAKNIVGGIFSQLGTDVTSKLTGLRNNVGAIFDTIGTWMHDKMVGAWKKVTDFVSGWPSIAFNWGVNLIQGLINGIGSMFGNLISTVQNVAGWIASHLGFHSSTFTPPKEGPAKDADKWMPALMHGLATGILEGAPNLRSALSGALQPLSTSLSVSASGSYTPLGFSGGGASSSSSSSGAGQTIILQLDSYQVGRILMPSIVSNIRNNLGINNL